MGDPGRGVYRRVAVSEVSGQVVVDVIDEAIFEGRSDLWTVAPSRSGACAFAFLLNHETGMRIPTGPEANPVADIGEVVRLRNGIVERLTVRGELAIDFEVVEAQWLSATKLPPDAYRVYPKGPKDEGWYPALCPVTDDIVLYSTPGGILLEVDFALQRVRELSRVGFPVRTLLLLSPEGPLAVTGSEGQFWLLEVDP
jgi:hypothetical protein